MELVWISELNGMDVNGLSLWEMQSRYIPVISAKKIIVFEGYSPIDEPGTFGSFIGWSMLVK